MLPAKREPLPPAGPVKLDRVRVRKDRRRWGREPITASERWLGRAARARVIAMMLSRADANMVETYAAECEAEAKCLSEERREVLIAA